MYLSTYLPTYSQLMLPWVGSRQICMIYDYTANSSSSSGTYFMGWICICAIYVQILLYSYEVSGNIISALVQIKHLISVG